MRGEEAISFDKMERLWSGKNIASIPPAIIKGETMRPKP
jgi:hypothetical protein